jgi:hypothetical protein
LQKLIAIANYIKQRSIAAYQELGSFRNSHTHRTEMRIFISGSFSTRAIGHQPPTHNPAQMKVLIVRSATPRNTNKTQPFPQNGFVPQTAGHPLKCTIMHNRAAERQPPLLSPVNSAQGPQAAQYSIVLLAARSSVLNSGDNVWVFRPPDQYATSPICKGAGRGGLLHCWSLMLTWRVLVRRLTLP